MNSNAYAEIDLGAATPEREPLIADVNRLIVRHGDEADYAAACLADKSFGAGDDTVGDHWTKVFQLLSAYHIGRAERLGNSG